MLVTANVAADGRVCFDPFADERDLVAWPSVADLVADFWHARRRPGYAAAGVDAASAAECVRALMDAGSPHAVDVLDALAAAAESDAELGVLGAGPLEHLLSHSGHGEQFVDEVEQRVWERPRLRRALGSVWLGADVPVDVRNRLVKLGAVDLS